MLCQNCGANNATSHIHSVINGVVHDKYLCCECAKKYRNSNFEDDGLLKILTSFLNEGVPNIKNSIQKCDCCGTSLYDISKTGKVGCCNCYNVFKNELIPTLVRIHGRTSHVGKNPYEYTEKATNQPTNNDEKIENLKRELSTAVANEEYEQAAILRDEIKALEGN